MAYHIGRPKEKIAIVEVKNGSSINDIAGINKNCLHVHNLKPLLYFILNHLSKN